MTRTIRPALTLLLAGLVTTAVLAQQPKGRPATSASSQPDKKETPKFAVVADTKLLMEGINLPNFRGLEDLLRKKPADEEVWAIVRGQSFLIAESGNLLLLRPPRSGGQDAWYRRATELRTAAAALGRAAAEKDFEACRNGLTELTATCNRCHTTFRVPVRFGPGADNPELGQEKGSRPLPPPKRGKE